MERRKKSIELMRYMQCFIQQGVFSPKVVQNAVQNYIKGEDEPLAVLINSPDIPVSCIMLVDAIKKIVNV